MIKYGVEQSEMIEYCIRQTLCGKMSNDEAIQKLKKHGVENAEEIVRDKKN